MQPTDKVFASSEPLGSTPSTKKWVWGEGAQLKVSACPLNSYVSPSVPTQFGTAIQNQLTILLAPISHKILLKEKLNLNLMEFI